MSRFAESRERIAVLAANARYRQLAYLLLAIVLAVLCVWPRPFVSRAKIVPQDPSSRLGTALGGANQLQDLAALFGGGRQAIDLYLTIGQSEDVRDEVIRDLKLVGSNSGYSTAQAARVRLEKHVDIESLPGGVLEIEVKTHDARESLRLAQAYTAAIAQRLKVLNNQQLATKQLLVDQRFRDAADRLGHAEADIDAFRRANRVSASPETELGSALAVRTALEGQLQAKLVEVHALQQFLGPENPRLTGAESQVAELRRQLTQSVDPITGAGGPNAGQLTELTNRYANLYRDYIFAQSMYQIYTQLSEQVAVEELSGKTASTVQMIEAPHVDAGLQYNVSAVAALALVALMALFTEVYAPATGIDLWRRKTIIAP